MGVPRHVTFPKINNCAIVYQIFFKKNEKNDILHFRRPSQRLVYNRQRTGYNQTMVKNIIGRCKAH